MADLGGAATRGVAGKLGDGGGGHNESADRLLRWSIFLRSGDNGGHRQPFDRAPAAAAKASKLFYTHHSTSSPTFLQPPNLSFVSFSSFPSFLRTPLYISSTAPTVSSVSLIQENREIHQVQEQIDV
ncbi:hypothetical protein Dimus_026276 [Dionaea muscipula]